MSVNCCSFFFLPFPLAQWFTRNNLNRSAKWKKVNEQRILHLPFNGSFGMKWGRTWMAGEINYISFTFFSQERERERKTVFYSGEGIKIERASNSLNTSKVEGQLICCFLSHLTFRRRRWWLWLFFPLLSLGLNESVWLWAFTCLNPDLPLLYYFPSSTVESSFWPL